VRLISRDCVALFFLYGRLIRYNKGSALPIVGAIAASLVGAIVASLVGAIAASLVGAIASI